MAKKTTDHSEASSESDWKNASLPLTDRVESWLSSTGFPLEYRTGTALAEAEFMVRQGSYVPGEHNYNGIEIDVIGTRTAKRACFTVIAECKVIPQGNFWVAMTNDRSTNTWTSSDMGRSRRARELEQEHPSHFRDVDPIFSQSTANQLKAMVLKSKASQQEPRGADGTAEENDPAYRAVQGLTGRVISHLKTAEQRKEAPDAGAMAEIVVPVLVVDGALTSATWDSAARKFKATALDFVWLSWTGHSRWPSSHASILVTKIEALPSLGNRLLLWSKKWCEAVAAAGRAERSADARHEREMEAIRNQHRLPDQL